MYRYTSAYNSDKYFASLENAYKYFSKNKRFLIPHQQISLEEFINMHYVKQINDILVGEGYFNEIAIWKPEQE